MHPWPAPDVATPRVMARTAGLFYVTGGAAALSCAATIRPVTTGAGLALLVIGGLAAGAGLGLVGRGHVLAPGAFHVVVLLVTAAVVVSPSADVAVALAAVYVLIAINCFFFFSMRHAVAHLCLLLVAQVAALASIPSVGAGVPVVMPLVCIAVAVVVGRLVQRASSASRDGLTGLLNRRGLEDTLRMALAAADRAGEPLALAILDIDGFRSVNERLGRSAGDELLRMLAATCRAAVPVSSGVARLDGDKFAVPMPSARSAAATAHVERIREALENCQFSSGIAVHVPNENGTELLRRAEAALYAAKAAGRGSTVVSGGGSDHLAVALAKAIADDLIDVAFQPILDLPTRSIVGVEALARWHDPVLGPVSPLEFVASAESSGLIADLGSAVLERACSGARRLSEAWGHRILLTVNVSGRELASPSYVDGVLALLRRTGWPAEDLVIEVTESLMEGSAASSLESVARLRAHGIAIAIDDFGTGYSSFSRLDSLPVDYLKLDHTFIAGTVTSPRRAGMLRAILDLAAALGLTVIAEGVETPEHESLLTSLLCPLVQGYLYDAPRSVDQLLASRGRTRATSATR